MEGEIYPLANGALFSVSATTGPQYLYTTFRSDGSSPTISFFDPTTSDGDKVSENPLYLFDNREVTKTEWEHLTRDFISWSKKPASLDGFDYKK